MMFRPCDRRESMPKFSLDDRVVYTGGHQRESGTVTGVNKFYVFVRYDGDRHSKATMPADLELEHREDK